MEQLASKIHELLRTYYDTKLLNTDLQKSEKDYDNLQNEFKESIGTKQLGNLDYLCELYDQKKKKEKDFYDLNIKLENQKNGVLEQLSFVGDLPFTISSIEKSSAGRESTRIYRVQITQKEGLSYLSFMKLPEETETFVL